MIQDIGYSYKNEYRNQLPKDDDFCMFIQGRSVLLKKNAEEIEYLRYRNVKEFISSDKLTYLFSIETEDGERAFFLGDMELLPDSIYEEYSFDNHNIFRVAKPKYLAFAGVTACQLGNWYKTTSFCGTCGTKLVHDSKERMMRCPSCKAMHYPRISPCVIVAVKSKDKILLTKYADRDYKRYALIAGFAETGETIEETVKREVMEEVGLKVKDIRYYKSQPWSFSDTLLFGFICEVDGSDQIELDYSELSVGEWHTREEIDMEFDDISLTNEMIIEFKKGNI